MGALTMDLATVANPSDSLSVGTQVSPQQQARRAYSMLLPSSCSMPPSILASPDLQKLLSTTMLINKSMGSLLGGTLGWPVLSSSCALQHPLTEALCRDANLCAT